MAERYTLLGWVKFLLFAPGCNFAGCLTEQKRELDRIDGFSVTILTKVDIVALLPLRDPDDIAFGAYNRIAPITADDVETLLHIFEQEKRTRLKCYPRTS